MRQPTSDLRIRTARPLLSPAILEEDLPLPEAGATLVDSARHAIGDILNGRDDRLVAIVGPCSIHDPAAALEYARQLKPVADRLARDLLVVMRVYFEKPRTVVGWKGLINDPHLDGSFQVNTGLRLARRLMLDISAAGLPIGTEFLDTTLGQYYADLVAWAAIGARADGGPGDEVRVILTERRVEELGADRQAGGADVEHQAAREPQAGVDLEAAVEVRVVDQALPADDRARLFKIDAHHHQQISREPVGDGLELPR